MMRTWPGIRDDTTSVSNDGLAVVIGANYFQEGVLKRRAGLTALSAFGGTALGTFRSPIGNAWLLIVRSNGNIESVAL